MFAWSKRYDTAGWLAQLSTHSDHRALPAAQRKRLFNAVGEAIDSWGARLRCPTRRCSS